MCNSGVIATNMVYLTMILCIQPALCCHSNECGICTCIWSTALCFVWVGSTAKTQYWLYSMCRDLWEWVGMMWCARLITAICPRGEILCCARTQNCSPNDTSTCHFNLVTLMKSFFLVRTIWDRPNGSYFLFWSKGPSKWTDLMGVTVLSSLKVLSKWTAPMGVTVLSGLKVCQCGPAQ